MSPAVARARPVKDRVQGIESSLSDLKLSNGKRLRVLLGEGIVPTPTLTRTIGGASSIKILVYDPDRKLLRTSLLSEDFTADLDGLKFRYLSAEKTGKLLELTLEERAVSLLRELTGPKKALRSKTTRAEFVISLIREVRPRIPFFCPELHVKQPIQNKNQGKTAKEDAKANRDKGLGDTQGLEVKGAAATREQIEIGDRSLRVAQSHKAPYQVQVALMAAEIVESLIGKISSNVLQLIPSTAAGGNIDPTDVEASVSGFLTGYLPGETGAIEYFEANPSAAPHEIAQAVQKSGAGLASNGAANYGPVVAEAREWVEAFEGGEFSGATTTTEPYTFEVGKDEDYWTAIKRLAKQVNWRAFFVAGKFFFIDEIDLYRGMVRLAINEDTPGIEGIDFRYNRNEKATEVTVSAYAKQWAVPPGAVVTLADYGPASIGFGDAPVKANKKGQQMGLSNNRNARTGEGRARYLVSSIESPIRDDDSDARLIEVKLRKPTAPLPEPAAETKTVSRGAASSGDIGAMGTLDGTPEDIVNQVVDYANANGFPDVTRESVRAANGAHGPTISGGTSDHQGPPNVRWAADISNGGSPTPEMDHLAAAIANAFNIPWSGSGLVSHSADGYRMQLIYRTMEGGNHFNHVHFGVSLG